MGGSWRNNKLRLLHPEMGWSVLLTVMFVFACLLASFVHVFVALCYIESSSVS